MPDTGAAEFDPQGAILEILSALEYDTRKEEVQILGPILDARGLKRSGKESLAAQIVRAPGFEAFFLDVLRAVRPFAEMLGDVYRFLNSNRATATRRASQFLVNFERAKTELTFDLANFPKQLLKALTEMEVFGSVVDLRFPGINFADRRLQWHNTEAEAVWGAVSPHWDNDFYDDGFHRALSYAHTVLDGTESRWRTRADGLVRPILDRLAACCQLADALHGDDRIAGRTVTHYLAGDAAGVTLRAISPRSHVIRDEAATYLTREVAEGSSNREPSTLLQVLSWEFQGFAISLNLWETGAHREDRSDWLQKRTGQALQHLAPEQYLQLLESLAAEYTERLDQVMPIVGDYSFHQVIESFLEFLNLPFWKHRWYLYELWTLVRVLDIAQRSWPVELNLTEVPESGALRWNLPGGSALEPVATIGDQPQQVYCWSQRKTYHPGSGAGLEPDLRLTVAQAGYHDILIAENKDRLPARRSEMAEILDRYVTGSCAESVWLVNYERFPESMVLLEKQWTDGRVHVASLFRPGSTGVFESDVYRILTRHLPITGPIASESLAPSPRRLRATLTWRGPPKDLDLHAWLVTPQGLVHVYYGARGSLHAGPYAELDNDHRTGDGREILTIDSPDLGSVTLAVHNYSGEPSLSGCAAALTIQMVGCPEILVPAPAIGHGCWWHVAVYTGGNNFKVLQTITDNPPQAA